jgi:hypothetical protein
LKKKVDLTLFNFLADAVSEWAFARWKKITLSGISPNRVISICFCLFIQL